MPVDALAPNDPRVEHKFCNVGDGITYHYMLAKPQGEPVATVVLCHGWPDLGMGWRYQVPYLLSLGLQVVVPDMLGYGQTSAPKEIEEYTMFKMTAHVQTLIKEVTGGSPIILGGHDWGALFVWRFVLRYPELVRAVFTFCVPFMPPSPQPTTLEQMVQAMPNFTYQLQFASGVAEKAIDQSPEHLRGFINGIYGGLTDEKQPIFDVSHGIFPDRLTKVQPTRLMTPEMVDHYVQEFSRHGMNGPLNWYKTQELNSKEWAPLAREKVESGEGGFKVEMPAMLVMAGQDKALPPRLADGQEAFFPKGLKKELVDEASHWVLVQTPEKCNTFIGEFVKEILGSELKSSL